jgi:hypothetical protein
MKTSEVLRRVRNHLSDEGYMHNHERYICFALHRLYLLSSIGDRDRTRVQSFVRAHLDGCQSLEHWLERHHGKPITNTPAYKKKIMATRKAWLTHLIEHYSHKGD